MLRDIPIAKLEEPLRRRLYELLRDKFKPKPARSVLIPDDPPGVIAPAESISPRAA